MNQFCLQLDAQEITTSLYLGWTIECQRSQGTVIESCPAPKQSTEQFWRFSSFGDMWISVIENARWNQRLVIVGPESPSGSQAEATEIAQAYIRRYYAAQYLGVWLPIVPRFKPDDDRQCELAAISREEGYLEPKTYWYIGLIKGQAEIIDVSGDSYYKSQSQAWREIERMIEDGWTA